jgi:hypothetical protein
MYDKYFIFLENRTVYEIMWKNIVDPGTPQMKIYMSHTPCGLDTSGYKHTLRICYTYCFCTATLITRTCLRVVLYVDSLLFLCRERVLNWRKTMQQDWLSVRVYTSNIIFIAFNFSSVTTQKHYCLQCTWNTVKTEREYSFFPSSYWIFWYLIWQARRMFTHTHTHTHTLLPEQWKQSAERSNNMLQYDPFAVVTYVYHSNAEV